MRGPVADDHSIRRACTVLARSSIVVAQKVIAKMAPVPRSRSPTMGMSAAPILRANDRLVATWEHGKSSFPPRDAAGPRVMSVHSPVYLSKGRLHRRSHDVREASQGMGMSSQDLVASADGMGKTPRWPVKPERGRGTRLPRAKRRASRPRTASGGRRRLSRRARRLIPGDRKHVQRLGRRDRGGGKDDFGPGRDSPCPRRSSPCPRSYDPCRR
jgi:hypothetical protein